MGVSHRRDKKDKCDHKTYFEVDQTMMLALQGATGKQTHEIMNEFTDIYESMIKDYELDLSKKSTGATWRYVGGYHTFGASGNYEWISKEVRRRRTKKFPGTNIYIACSVTVTYCPVNFDEWNEYHKHSWSPKKKEMCVKAKGNTNVVKVNFIMPTRKKLLDQEAVQEILLEGEIFDTSEDLADLDFKDSVTPAEKRARAEAKKKKRAEKQIATINNKLESGKELTKQQRKAYLKLIDDGYKDRLIADSIKG